MTGRSPFGACTNQEALIRSFAEHSSSLLWIANVRTGVIEYRSSAFERIWGEVVAQAGGVLADLFEHVHPNDLDRVRRATRSIESGDCAKMEYRITRSCDGATRWLRDSLFPIRDRRGKIVRIGGITEDLTATDRNQVYIVGSSPKETRRLTQLLQGLDFEVRAFPKCAAFLNVATALSPGCVLLDLRQSPADALAISAEMGARATPLTVIVIGPDDGDVAIAVEAMKSGAADYLHPPVTQSALTTALRGLRSVQESALIQSPSGDDPSARLARLTGREREVLNGLMEGGTNKTIALQLGLSPRTVELYRGQIMAKFNARSLAEVLQLAMVANGWPNERRASAGRSSR